jgi:hypothetical protein
VCLFVDCHKDRASHNLRDATVKRGGYQRNELCRTLGARLPRMDKSRAPETDRFRISDYLGHGTERELALSPHAPRDLSEKNRPMVAFHDCVEQSGLSDEELMFRSLPRGEDR